MTVASKVIIESKSAENALTTQYTFPTGTRTIIDKFTATNYSAGSETISVYLVPSGGSAGDDNITPKAKALAAGETYTFPEIVGHTLESGDFIATDPSTGGAINIRATGRQIT